MHSVTYRKLNVMLFSSFLNRFNASVQDSSSLASALPRRSFVLGACGVAVSALALAPVGIVGCRVAAELPYPDRAAALKATVTGVLLPTFQAQVDAGGALREAAAAFVNAPDAARLTQLRAQFREAFIATKRTEVFHFGPSEDVLLADSIDSRPINVTRLDQIVNGTDQLDIAFVQRQSASARGLPGLEYLLYNSAALPNDVDRLLLGDDQQSARRRQLLIALTADYAQQTAALRDAWAGPQGYANELLIAGKGSKVFASQKDAIDRLVTGMLYIAELALVAKLVKPMGIDKGVPPRTENEEAPRSDFSLLALEQNILAIEATYKATMPGAGTGTNSAPASLAIETRTQAPSAHDAFEAVLARALREIRAMQVPMRQVLASGNVAGLKAVQVAVRDVKRTIATEVASALAASIGFGYSDTD
jgi:predicted lipoprotein